MKQHLRMESLVQSTETQQKARFGTAVPVDGVKNRVILRNVLREALRGSAIRCSGRAAGRNTRWVRDLLVGRAPGRCSLFTKGLLDADAVAFDSSRRCAGVVFGLFGPEGSRPEYGRRWYAPGSCGDPRQPDGDRQRQLYRRRPARLEVLPGPGAGVDRGD